MNMIWRDDANDTGEQDVRELRQQHAETAPMPLNEPHLRDKEDVPHEGSIPDFYGLSYEDEVDEELSALVDAGELCMGWDSDTQEIIYWLPEEPKLAEQPEPAPKLRSHRARKPVARSSWQRRIMLTVAATIAPFFIGMTAEAAMDLHAQGTHPMDRPDMAGNDVPVPEPSKTAVATSARTAVVNTYRPTGSSYQMAAQSPEETATTTADKPKAPAGKHRRVPTKHRDGARVKTSGKTESKTPNRADQTPLKHLPALSPPSRPRIDTPVETVVTSILGQAESLLK
jgi:hypothetical protein